MDTCIFAVEGKYGRTLPVAVGLIAYQNEESFEWLFRKVVEARKNKSFDTLFTDQDPAIGRAASSALPNTKHLLCIWHICSQNLPKNLKKYSMGKKKFVNFGKT